MLVLAYYFYRTLHTPNLALLQRKTLSSVKLGWMQGFPVLEGKQLRFAGGGFNSGLRD